MPQVGISNVMCYKTGKLPLLDNLGYPTSPNQNFRDNSKSQILKIGVGFFCLMNIMLLSSADYLSDDLEGTVFYSLFRYISMALASLALIYPGLPFYQNTFRALKKGHIHRAVIKPSKRNKNYTVLLVCLPAI